MAAKEQQRIVITKPGTLAFGTNLGLHPGSDVETFLRDETVVQMACGCDHSAIVCKSGRVYTFSINNKATRRWMANIGTVSEPSLVATLGNLKVVQAACGKRFTMYLTDKGMIYARGLNDYGQLGLGHTETTPSPALVSGPPPVKSVAAGCDFTVVLTVCSEVWVCGGNYDGKLGLGDTKNRSHIVKIHYLQELIWPRSVSCGWYHTALISSSQVVWTTCYEYGTVFRPAFEPSIRVAAVSCGDDHTVTLRADRTVWAWGQNDCGQLGIGNTNHQSTPTQMIGLENHTITEVIAGWCHTALLTEEGDVLVCGRGKDGELGLGKEDLLMATLLPKSPGLAVQQVAFAETFSLILVKPKLNIKTVPQVDQDDETRSCITDWEKSFMKSLECHVCFKIMCAPIHQCSNGHSLCSACRSHKNIKVCPLCQQVFIKTRNIVLESLSAEIQLPCTECLQRMPTSELENHVKVCPKLTYSCPLQQSCGWMGRPDTVLSHTVSAHPDQTWQDLPHLFLHSTSDELVHTDVLGAHNQAFKLHRTYNKTTGEFRAVVSYIGLPEFMNKFMFEFKFMNNKVERIFRNNLCSDIDSVGDLFQSSDCVLLKRESVDKFLQQGCLVCQVAILMVKSSDLADKIIALLSA